MKTIIVVSLLTLSQLALAATEFECQDKKTHEVAQIKVTNGIWPFKNIKISFADGQSEKYSSDFRSVTDPTLYETSDGNIHSAKGDFRQYGKSDEHLGFGITSQGTHINIEEKLFAEGETSGKIYYFKFYQHVGMLTGTRGSSTFHDYDCNKVIK